MILIALVLNTLLGIVCLVEDGNNLVVRAEVVGVVEEAEVVDEVAGGVAFRELMSQQRILMQNWMLIMMRYKK